MTEQKLVPRQPESQLILIVDDEATIAEVLAEFVSDLGYKPLMAQNGQEALDLARKHWPTLVMTDVMMPIMNGKDFVQALRKEASAHQKVIPPIILLTAAGKNIVTDLDVDAVITKPFELDELERLLQRFLSHLAT